MKEIKIDVTKLAEAPIDDKNVMSDWLVDTLFDEQEYTGYGHEYMGFVGGFPTYMTYQGNMAEFSFLKRPASGDEKEIWNGTIVERLTYNDYEVICSQLFDVSRTYIDDERENDMKHILNFTLGSDESSVGFYWNVPKN